jgi:ankyrin repeat protein
MGKRLDKKLERATLAGDLDLVRDLLAQGASIESPPPYLGPLGVAAGAGHFAVLLELLACDPSTRILGGALHCAALDGNVELVRLLLEHGAPVNMRGGYGETAVDQAEMNRHEQVADFLRKHGGKSSLDP